MPLDATNYSPEPRDIGAERLRILADFLDTVPPERFNIEYWHSYCGTTACAIGHAYSIAEFRVAGFSCVRGSLLGPGFKGRFGGGAIMAFFGLTSEQAERLFYPVHYERSERRNPSAVAARIRAHLAARVERVEVAS